MSCFLCGKPPIWAWTSSAIIPITTRPQNAVVLGLIPHRAKFKVQASSMVDSSSSSSSDYSSNFSNRIEQACNLPRLHVLLATRMGMLNANGVQGSTQCSDCKGLDFEQSG